MVIVIMSNLEVLDGDGDPAVLTISGVSQRTGITVAGLRNWEQRYGLPRPLRLASGRRRYREADCALLADVLRRRAGACRCPLPARGDTCPRKLSATAGMGSGL
jgi:hypothetical protein